MRHFVHQLSVRLVHPVLGEGDLPALVDDVHPVLGEGVTVLGEGVTVLGEGVTYLHLSMTFILYLVRV